MVSSYLHILFVLHISGVYFSYLFMVERLMGFSFLDEVYLPTARKVEILAGNVDCFGF